MPDRDGNFKGVALGGKASEAWERIFGCPPGCAECERVEDWQRRSAARDMARQDPAPEDAGSE